MEAQAEWYRNYHRAAYIDWGFPNRERDKAFTRCCTAELNWEYDELQGDPGLLQRLVDGDWRADEFLVLQPGELSVADPAGPLILKAAQQQSVVSKQSQNDLSNNPHGSSKL